jgi:hypothetical protein
MINSSDWACARNTLNRKKTAASDRIANGLFKRARQR